MSADTPDFDEKSQEQLDQGRKDVADAFFKGAADAPNLYQQWLDQWDARINPGGERRKKSGRTLFQSLSR